MVKSVHLALRSGSMVSLTARQTHHASCAGAGRPRRMLIHVHSNTVPCHIQAPLSALSPSLSAALHRLFLSSGSDNARQVQLRRRRRLLILLSLSPLQLAQRGQLTPCDIAFAVYSTPVFTLSVCAILFVCARKPVFAMRHSFARSWPL